MQTRTDLALEGVSSEQLEEGITQKKRGEVFKITEVIIEEDRHGEKIGKKKGRYITLEGDSLSRFCDDYEAMVTELAGELREIVPDGQILIVGLGNNDITPDALGPQVSAKILATRHLKDELSEEMAEEKFLKSLRQVSVIAAGVLGQTGIETVEIVTALDEKIKPDAVIAIDALACSDIARLGTTVQISDAGISPGSGVQNKRKEISRNSLGIPVIAIGVPTVVDMHTIVQTLSGRKVDSELPNMMVTPRDVDKLIERAARLIANAINLALHPQMSFEDVIAIDS